MPASLNKSRSVSESSNPSGEAFCVTVIFLRGFGVSFRVSLAAVVTAPFSKPQDGALIFKYMWNNISESAKNKSGCIPMCSVRVLPARRAKTILPIDMAKGMVNLFLSSVRLGGPRVKRPLIISCNLLAWRIMNINPTIDSVSIACHEERLILVMPRKPSP